MPLLVIDLSHWNTVKSLQTVANAGLVGVIHKASEGDGYVDPTYADRREEALRAGLCWGAYHFGTSADVDDQVNNFLAAADPDDETLVALDLEDYEQNSMGLDAAEEFVEKVEEALGRPLGCVLYSGNRIKELVPEPSVFWGSRRLWLAHYCSPPPELPTSWDRYFLWQYTDRAQVDGIEGPVDGNEYAGTPAELRAAWSPRFEPDEPVVEGDDVSVTVARETTTTTSVEVERGCDDEEEKRPVHPARGRSRPARRSATKAKKKGRK